MKAVIRQIGFWVVGVDGGGDKNSGGM